MNEKIDVNVKTLRPFTKILMTIGELPTSYLMSMTYYEQIIWFTKYLQEQVIPAVNTNAEAVSELQNLFTELQDYVNHYFDSLDLQEEVNTKLDEMAESGELEAIIQEYLDFNIAKIYENVNSFVTDTNLEAGNYVRTLGYYSLNDGGSALYKIVDDNEINVDGSFVIELNNNLKALLIHNNTEIVAEVLGFKSDENFNNTTIFNSIMNNNNTITKPITILFGCKNYYFDETLIYSNTKFYIKGFSNSNIGSYERTTFFKPYRNNQRYILKIGGTASFDVPENWHTYWKTNYKIENISFSDDVKPLQAPSSPFNEKYGLLCIEYFSGIELNVCFHDTNSRCIYMKNCWEVYFKYLSLTGISCPFNESCVYLDDNLQDGTSNTSAYYFDFINVESVNAPVIKTSRNLLIQNWIIKTLSIENGLRTAKDILGKPIANITSQSTFEECTPYGIFEFNCGVNGLQIGEMNIHNLGNKYFYIDNSNTKGVDVLMKLDRTYNISIDSVNFNICGGFQKIFGTGTADQYIESVLTINSMLYTPTALPNNPLSNGTDLLGYFYNSIPYGLININSTNMISSSVILPVKPGIYKNLDLKLIGDNHYGRLRYGRSAISENAITSIFGSDVFSKKLLINYPCTIKVGINPKSISGNNPRIGCYYRKTDNTYGGAITTSITSDNLEKNNILSFTLSSEIINTYPAISLLAGDITINSIDFVEIIAN